MFACVAALLLVGAASPARAESARGGKAEVDMAALRELAYHEVIMRERPSSRLLVLDRLDRVLLFKFEHKRGSLAGQSFWATPGGGVDPSESYVQAARRELFEEIGLLIDDPGPEVDRRIVTFQTPEGETVRADERFFLVRVEAAQLFSTERWSGLEREVMTTHRWWSAVELRSTAEQVWPENLPDVLARIGVWADSSD